MPSTPPSGLRLFAPGQDSQTGEVHRSGPDRKPRQVHRLALTRALVAVKQKNGRSVPGVEDLALGYREILGDHNHKFFLQLGQLVKETFDDAPDSGSGHITRFIFASEVEEERRKAGQLPTSAEGQAPATAPGPLAGMGEVEEPGG